MIEIVTGLLVFIATSRGLRGNQNDVAQTAPKAATRQEIGITESRASRQAIASNSHSGMSKSQIEVEQRVNAYFANTPLLTQIAGCESRYNQFGKDGQIYRGEINNADVGVMQINEYYHLETSKKLGFDIHTLEGNMGYAKYLYDHEGSDPWSSSSYCWKKYENISTTGHQLALAKK